jgi:hypothetical protein
MMTTEFTPSLLEKNRRRWARLLKQQMSITVYLLPTKEKKLTVFRLQKTNRSFAVFVFL